MTELRKSSGPHISRTVLGLRAGAVVVLAAALAFQAGMVGADDVAVAHVRMRHSQFEPATFAVAPGTTVKFVVTNVDPIDHEFLLGGPEVQAAHELGTEPAHGDRPGELSLAPGETKTTTFRFPEVAGPVVFACHLPGHFAYGMKGVVLVR